MRALGAVVALVVVGGAAWGQSADSADVPMAPAHKTAAQIKLPPSKIAPGVPLSQRERALQMLNRFTYGARPGDVEKVMAMGPDKWFAAQLMPETVADPVMNRRMKEYPTLGLTTEEMLLIFPDRYGVQQVTDGKRPYPADPLLASEYEVQVYKELGDRDYKHKGQMTDADRAAAKKVDDATAARVAAEMLALPKGYRMAALEALPVEQRVAFANNVRYDLRQAFVADLTPREKEVFVAMGSGTGPVYRIFEELVQSKLLRQIQSERQVQEVMTDFWFNHFNVFEPKDQDVFYTTSYERDAIRTHALGKFRDLLLATAESPAMMVYLDNYLSIGPDSLANGVDPNNPKSKKGGRGLNENYGREVMELHTVGVGGGYTQQDVTHLSSILTGWGVERPAMAGPFQFDPKRHEPGTKQWFGYTIDEEGNVLSAPAGMPVPKVTISEETPQGMKQGIAALSLLAASPKTAHFISYMLAQRFIADEPPPALVDRMTTAYMASDGDIKTVLRTLTLSPEFGSHRYFRNKVKTPNEFVASAFRATSTDPSNLGALVTILDRTFGEPLYKKLEPTGYYITADRWMNTQALLGRLNFADDLTHGRVGGQKFDSSRVLALSLMSDRAGAMASLNAGTGEAKLVRASAPVGALPGPEVALRVLEGTLIGGEISPGTDRFIHSQLAEQNPNDVTQTLNLLTALLIGSPEFQLR